jgi:general secretion pathway protein G
MIRSVRPAVHAAQAVPSLSGAGRRGGCMRGATRRTAGFTLIEVLVVVVILGILAAVVVPRFFDKPGEARQVRAKADIQGLVTALNLYRLDNFAYPSTEQGLQALVQKPSGLPEARNWKSGGYLQNLPKDPWGRDYVYLSPGQRGEIDVYSLGLDGQPGGDAENADVGNWGE